MGYLTFCVVEVTPVLGSSQPVLGATMQYGKSEIWLFLKVYSYE